jgi:hypothetical protein
MLQRNSCEEDEILGNKPKACEQQLEPLFDT